MLSRDFLQDFSSRALAEMRFAKRSAFKMSQTLARRWRINRRTKNRLDDGRRDGFLNGLADANRVAPFFSSRLQRGLGAQHNVHDSDRYRTVRHADAGG